MAVVLDFLQAAETEEQAAGPASTLDTMWLEMVEAEAMAAAVAEAMEPRVATAVIVTELPVAAAAMVGQEKMRLVVTVAEVVATAQTTTALAEMAGPQAKRGVLY